LKLRHYSEETANEESAEVVSQLHKVGWFRLN
jgi:hypothetical protein